MNKEHENISSQSQMSNYQLSIKGCKVFSMRILTGFVLNRKIKLYIFLSNDKTG